MNGLINGTRLNLSTSLYSDLAAGAQSGMDYSAGRWARQPLANTNDSQANLRTLNINNQIPVDLNSILYRNYVLISSLYNITGNSSRSQYWAQRAASTREAILVRGHSLKQRCVQSYSLTLARIGCLLGQFLARLPGLEYVSQCQSEYLVERQVRHAQWKIR